MRRNVFPCTCYKAITERLVYERYRMSRKKKRDIGEKKKEVEMKQ